MITRVMERIEVPFTRKIVLPKVTVEMLLPFPLQITQMEKIEEHWCCNWASLLHANGKAELEKTKHSHNSRHLVNSGIKT
jgi:hypothetical protein